MADHVIVNGTERSWRPGLGIGDLLDEVLATEHDHSSAADRHLGPAPSGVAVAVNDVVVPRRRWPEQVITAGDRIEIVTAVQGG